MYLVIHIDKLNQEEKESYANALIFYSENYNEALNVASQNAAYRLFEEVDQHYQP